MLSTSKIVGVIARKSSALRETDALTIEGTLLLLNESQALERA